MLVKSHIIIGAIISTILYLIFQLTPLQTLIIFLASFLIDVDHYLYYILTKKSLSLKKAHNWFFERRKAWLKLSHKKRKKGKRTILLFHSVWLIILLIILSYIHSIFLFILIGMLIHLTLDYIELIYLKEPLYPKLFPIYVSISNKKKKELLDSIEDIFN